MSEKVYCKQCRYYIPEVDYTYESCYTPQNCKPNITSARDTYKEHESKIINVLTKEKPHILNINNGCKYYKPKWQVFVIKTFKNLGNVIVTNINKLGNK